MDWPHFKYPKATCVSSGDRGNSEKARGVLHALILGRGKIFVESKHSVKSSCRILVKKKKKEEGEDHHRLP